MDGRNERDSGGISHLGTLAAVYLSDKANTWYLKNGAKVELLFISRIQPHLVNLRSLKLGPLRFLSSVEFLGVLRDTPKLEELDFHYNNWANLSLVRRPLLYHRNLLIHIV